MRTECKVQFPAAAVFYYILIGVGFARKAIPIPLINEHNHVFVIT